MVMAGQAADCKSAIRQIENLRYEAFSFALGPIVVELGAPLNIGYALPPHPALSLGERERLFVRRGVRETV